MVRLAICLVALGCSLRSDVKNRCETQADCLEGYTCTSAGTCEHPMEITVDACVPRTCDGQCGTIGDLLRGR